MDEIRNNKKAIRKSDLKYAAKSQLLDYIVAEINKRGVRKKTVTWCLSPNSLYDINKENRKVFTEIIYSMAKVRTIKTKCHITWYGISYKYVHEGSANETIKSIADILSVPFSWVERFMRGDEKRILLDTKWGLDNLTVL